jgi:hypothetical protein
MYEEIYEYSANLIASIFLGRGLPRSRMYGGLYDSLL